MANEEHVAKLLQGVEVWNEWRKENPHIWPDLRDADLGADRYSPDLRSINLQGARLRVRHETSVPICGCAAYTGKDDV